MCHNSFCNALGCMGERYIQAIFAPIHGEYELKL
jgi:hypothetical protein